MIINIEVEPSEDVDANTAERFFLIEFLGVCTVLYSTVQYNTLLYEYGTVRYFYFYDYCSTFVLGSSLLFALCWLSRLGVRISSGLAGFSTVLYCNFLTFREKSPHVDYSTVIR